MKSQICPNCCPAGGALFDRVGQWDLDGNRLADVNECRNCHAIKPIRKAPAKVIARRAERNARLAATIAWLEAEIAAEEAGEKAAA